MIFLNYISKLTQDLVFPKKCFGCSVISSEYICPSCFLKYVFIKDELPCVVCGKPTKNGFTHSDCLQKTYLDGVIPMMSFEGLIADVLHRGKYSGIYDIYNFLGRLLARHVRISLKEEIVPDTIITYVPMHKSKVSKRGFNQAKILANSFSRELELPCYSLIDRVINTKTQVTQSRTSREVNLIGAFKPSKKDLSKKMIFLIDDIFTTGTTLNLCAKELKSCGAKKVFAFTVASGR